MSAKTEAMVVQHCTAWPRGATWRSALWAVSIAYQATTTASARVGVLPLEASLPYTMWLMSEKSAHLFPIRSLSCKGTARYRKVGAQAIYHARVLAASHSIYGRVVAEGALLYTDCPKNPCRRGSRASRRGLASLTALLYVGCMYGSCCGHL